MKTILFVPGRWVDPDALDKQTIIRCEKALDLWKRGHFDLMVVAGGWFRAGQKKSCADMMAAYMQAKGVSSSVIVKEDRSTDTFQNVAFALDLLKARGIEPAEMSTMIVADFLHALRTKMIFRFRGVKSSIVVSNYLISPKQMAVETISLLWTRFVDHFGDGKIAQSIQQRRAVNARKSEY